jgi:hypothetical protein
MEVEQEVCAYCGRPRDEREIERGKAELEERALIERRRPRLLAAWGAGLLAALALYSARDLLSDLAASRYDAFMTEVRSVEGDGAPAARPPRPQPVEPPRAPPPRQPSIVWTSAPPPAATRAEPVLVVVRRPPPKPAPPPEPAAPRKLPPRVATPAPVPGEPTLPDQRRVYGVVYDLLTGAPVPSATIFVSGGASNGLPVGSQTTTDAAGHYRIDVPLDPPGGTALVSVKAAGYRDGEMTDADPPYLGRPPARRAEIAQNATDADLEPIPLFPSDPRTLVRLDIVLIPVK